MGRPRTVCGAPAPKRQGKTMKTILTGLTAAIVAATIFAASAYAGALETVTVTGSRSVSEKALTRSPIGAPIKEVSISYKVSAADLDLTTSAGKAELEKRVTAAANSACKEIDRLALGNPTTPDNAACAKAAVKTAMEQVH